MGSLLEGNLAVAMLLSAGLIGGIGLVIGQRIRRRGLTCVGVLLAITGFSAFGLAFIGVIPARYLEAIDRRLKATQLPTGSAIGWDQVEQFLDDAEVGVLSEAEFKKLLDFTLAGRSRNSTPDDVIERVQERLRADRLPVRYVDLTVDWLIQSWPAWRPASAHDVDEVPDRVLGTRNLSPGARDRFIDFMLKQQGDPKQSMPRDWYAALDSLILRGGLDEQRLSTYLGNLACRKLELKASGDELWRGDVATCRVVVPSDPMQMLRGGSGLPWRGTMKVREGPVAFAGGTLRLPYFPFDGSGQLAKVLLPDTPGEHQLVIDVSAELTRDDLRGYLLANPGKRSAGMRPQSLVGTRVQKQMTLKFVVLDKRAEAPTVIEAASLAPRIAGCAAMSNWPMISVQGDGSGWAAGQLFLKDPPVALAMDIVWVIEGKEHVVGWFAAPAGKTTRVAYGGDVARYRGGKCPMILRPNLTLIKNPRGMPEVYDGPDITLTVESITR